MMHHRVCHFDYTAIRRLEIEPEMLSGPEGRPDLTATCPSCGYAMAYRGKARLRGGASVHYFECVHSYREVHIVHIAEQHGASVAVSE
jgi:hypothetical protein